MKENIKLDSGFVEQKGAVYWSPDTEGQTLKGKVVDMKTGEYGLQYTIEDDKGEKVVTPSHAALQARMAAVKAGNSVQIVYLGEDLKNKKKGQNALKMYQVGIKV